MRKFSATFYKMLKQLKATLLHLETGPSIGLAFSLLLILGSAVVLSGCTRWLSSNTSLQPSIALASETHYFDQTAKTYKPIDTTLKPNKVVRGAFENTTNTLISRYAATPTTKAAVEAENTAGKLAFSTLAQQTFGTLKKTTSKAAGNTITYSEVFPGMDLKYTSLPGRILEEFIVHDSATALTVSQIDQEVILNDVTHYEKVGEELHFYNGRTKAFIAPAPVLYELSNTSERSYGITYKVVDDGGNLIVSKVITDAGKEWLSSTDRQYPIAIDLVLDNADTIGNWTSSNSTSLPISAEGTIVQEGTNSVKIDPAAWWDASWSYRATLTFDNSGRAENLTDFPVLVALNSSRLTTYSSIQADCDDIRFIDSNNSTVLDYEIESCNTGGTSYFWVEVPQIDSSSSSDFIYVYYGNNSATAVANAANTWNSGYAMVHHLEEGTTGATDFQDSTTNNRDSTAVQVTSATATGRVYRGVNFDGTNDYIATADIDYGTGNDTTISAWVNFTSCAGNGDMCYIVTKNQFTSTSPYSIGVRTLDAFYFTVRSSTTYITSATGFDDGNWHHVVGVLDNTTAELFVDGTSIGTQTYTPTNTNDLVTIGGDDAVATYRPFNGIIDEVRISQVARTDAWVNAEYHSDRDSLITYGSEVPNPVGQTATKTFGVAQDLSSYNNITFWVRSDRTGSFMRIQMGESASTEQTYDFSITSANTWEQKTWDISGITGTARDAITKLAFTPTNISTDFVFYFDDIQATGAAGTPNPQQLHYRWRNDDGSETTATWAAAEDTTLSNMVKLTAYRLRFLISNEGTADATSYAYRIEVSEANPVSCASGTYERLNTDADWEITAVTFTDGSATTNVASGLTDENSSFVAGETKDAGDSTGAITLTSSQFTEVEYGLRAKSAATNGATYCFRLTNAGSTSNFTYTTYAQGSLETPDVNDAPSAPTNLLTEGSTNPAGVTDTTPEFAATYNDLDLSDNALNYQIQVNTASDFTGTSMWDSGKTSMTSTPQGTQSPNISYAGTALSENGATYYWRIKFWDTADAEGTYSAAAQFTMSNVTTGNFNLEGVGLDGLSIN